MWMLLRNNYDFKKKIKNHDMLEFFFKFSQLKKNLSVSKI